VHGHEHYAFPSEYIDGSGTFFEEFEAEYMGMAYSLESFRKSIEVTGVWDAGHHELL